MPTRKLTGTRIRQKRLDEGIRQAQLAAAVGISPSYLNLIEHNRRRIAGKLLADLARALGAEPALLAEGADTDLVNQMHEAAGRAGVQVEIDHTEDIITRYPGWSDLIVGQARDIAALETRVQALQDRMTHDPQLAAALHEVISSVTAIRSTASILVGQDDLDSDWQHRFHINIHADSLRLAQSSEVLMGTLDAAGDDSAAQKTPTEEMENFLSATGFHLQELERDLPDVDKFVAGSGLGQAAAELLKAHAELYSRDVSALPLEEFSRASFAEDHDPACLARLFGCGFAQVLRRMASLPTDLGHPPMGLAVCDASGTVRLLKRVPGFSLSRAGSACPLWPVYSAFSRPSQPTRCEVALPGPSFTRFLCYAIAEPASVATFDAAPLLRSTMLVLPDQAAGAVPALKVGPSCRICPRNDCSARHESPLPGLA